LGSGCPHVEGPSAKDDRIINDLEPHSTFFPEVPFVVSKRSHSHCGQSLARAASVISCISQAFDFVVARKPSVSYPHLQPPCRLLRKVLKERKTRETPAEEEVAEVEDVEEALVEVQLRIAQLLRETVEKAEVVEDEDEAGVVVAEGVEEETELSRKDKDQQTYNQHHNPVAQASLVVAWPRTPRTLKARTTTTPMCALSVHRQSTTTV
jgi:hypothetical protein